MEKNSLKAIVMATMIEAKPFVEGLLLEPAEKKPFLVFKNQKYVLVVCGIGKANAAMATAYCCIKFKPDAVFNIGAAGALTLSKPRGEIYRINRVIEHDRPDFRTAKPFIHNIPTIDSIKAETAILSTSDKAAVSPEEREKVSQYGGELVDMEGASIIQTCRKFQTPCFLFKYVSDTPEDTDNSSIRGKIREYRKKSFLFFTHNIHKIETQIKS